MNDYNSSTGSMEHAHECDLLLVACEKRDRAVDALPHFAQKGQQNKDGWGVGFFAGNTAKVVRDFTPALSGSEVHPDVVRIAEKAKSRIFICHLRFASSQYRHGPATRTNNHPFKITNRLGGDWLFAHNGTVERPDLLGTGPRRVLKAATDSPRIFEFMLHEMEQYLPSTSVSGVIDAAAHAYEQLHQRLKGTRATTNLLLSNGKLAFAFLHHRKWWLQRRLKGSSPAYLLSTRPLMENRPDIEIKEELPLHQMLVFSDGVLLTRRATNAGNA